MAKVDSVFRELNKALKPYAVQVEKGKNHARVMNTRTNKRIQSIAGSPSCPYFAQHLIQNLVRDGILPDEMRRKKFLP